MYKRQLRAGRLVLHTNTVNLLVAVAFTAMGIGVISLAGATTMTGPGNWFQQAAGQGLTEFARATLAWLAPVPEPVLGVGLLALAGAFVWYTLRDRPRPQLEAPAPDPEELPALPDREHACHTQTPDHDHARN